MGGQRESHDPAPEAMWILPGFKNIGLSHFNYASSKNLNSRNPLYEGQLRDITIGILLLRMGDRRSLRPSHDPDPRKTWVLPDFKNIYGRRILIRPLRKI